VRERSLSFSLSLSWPPPNCGSKFCCRPFVCMFLYALRFTRLSLKRRRRHCVSLYLYIRSWSLSLYLTICLRSVYVCVCFSLACTCCILLLDFTLFSYTFACRFTHYVSRHFSGSTSSRGLLLLLPPSIVAVVCVCVCFCFCCCCFCFVHVSYFCGV